eukprot:scaffold2491_cov127-Skeletonema_marinoi.AAC.1
MDNLCGSKLALIIRRSNSPKFTLNVRSSHTISDVKNELSEMECVSSDKLCVLFNGQLLKDNRTLSDYNIANENNLDLVENRTIHIFVKISGGDTISLGATLTTPIASLKDMISEKVGIAKAEQRLCYGAKQLDDSRTLIEYNIYEECTLDLLGRMRGGNPDPDGNHISQVSSSTTNEMPPPTELISSHVVSSRGIYSHESGDCISIKGSWALGLDILENPQGERNEFLYKSQGTGSSQEIPQSGTYTGWFLFNASNQNGMVEQITVTDEVQLEFIENNKGFYNVGGNGSNQYGSYTVAGTLKDSLFTINRTFSSEKDAVDEDDLPSRPVRISSSPPSFHRHCSTVSMNDFNSSPFEDLPEPNAGANLDYNVETEEFTVDWCKKELNSIRSKYNTNVIDFLIKVILPQVGADKIIPILIGLCPTPESRGHESLGGEGRRDPERKTALSILLMRLLNECLPTREQGGIYSGNPDVSNGAWLNAREMCTNDGVTCILCKPWFKVEGVDIGKALCALSKCVKYYGGHTVAVNMAGVSVNTHYLFDYLRAHGRFDGLCEYGTHISKLGSKCRAWTKSYQCNMAASTLAAIDKAFKPSFEQIGFKPSLSFLQMGLQNPLFKYVTKDGNVTTFAETCADCGECDATVVDMLQMESSTVNESSFNEGQDEEEEDDHECSDDGDNIARCMVCDKCAQARARVNEYDDEGNFMPISEFRQESKRAAAREREAAWRAKLKEDPVKWEERKEKRKEKRKESKEKRKAKHKAAYVKKIKLAKYVISSLDDNIGALYNAASGNCAAGWTGLSNGPINKALKGDGLISYRGTELYRIREAAPRENLAVGMTEAGEMNWHYSVDVPATWSSDCTDEDEMGALALLVT